MGSCLPFVCSGSLDFCSEMGADAKSDLVPYVNTWLWPSVGLVASSSLFFSIYIGKVTNSHEWKDIFLDYCHHKRTYYTPHVMDKIARVVTGILKIAPK